MVVPGRVARSKGVVAVEVDVLVDQSGDGRRPSEVARAPQGGEDGAALAGALGGRSTTVAV